MREWRIWFDGTEWAQSCDLPLSFLKWRLIGIRPMIASTPDDREVLNAPRIQIAALLCIFPNCFKG